MHSQLPASFASAASSNGANDGGSGPRNASGDWSRARTNGATQTFRRPSVASGSGTVRESSQGTMATPTTGVYVPPHLTSSYQPSSRNPPTDCRYSKEQLLDHFKLQDEAGLGTKDVVGLLVDGWNPYETKTISNGTWSRRDEYKDGNAGPEICWDLDGLVQPLGLSEMDAEEKELFSSSVNSPLKPPPQNGSKEGGPTTGINGRKASISQGQGNAPAAVQGNRPTPRRRETSDSLSNASLASPSLFNRTFKEDSQTPTPPSLVRRRNEVKDSFGPSLEKIKNSETDIPPFGSIKRTANGPHTAGLNGPSSPWSNAPQSAGFPLTGAFGSFSISGPSDSAATGVKGPGLGGARAESRFKGLMGNDGSDEPPSKLRAKASIGSLGKVPEFDPDGSRTKNSFGRSTRPGSEAQNRIGINQASGSAALGGDEPSPPLQGFFSQGADLKAHHDVGFSSFGAPSHPPLREPARESLRPDTFPHQTPHGRRSGENLNEPMSPTSTNPYTSPEAERLAREMEPNDEPSLANMQHTYGLPGGSRNLNTAHEATSDRSRNSSAGPARGISHTGLGNLGGLGHAGPWSGASSAVGATGRTVPALSSGFNESIFSSMADVQSPGAFATPTASTFGNVGTIGRGTRLGSLFPSSTHDSMKASTMDQNLGESREPGLGRQSHSTNAPGFGIPGRDTDNFSRTNHGVLDDLFGNVDGRTRGSSIAGPFHGNDSTAHLGFSHAPTSITGLTTATMATSLHGRGSEQEPAGGIATQMPATQQRQMVMPDRMRWIYRDPQGNTQGPWSGLEMHDWYKAGFFSPELQVKKQEDADYEPLAQLIRRIGNSREPFLVPQIGIPHGPATTQAPNGGSTLTSASASTSGLPSGAAQPPFAGSFPSFGTTLTAEQQNALERRKQEEQYLMARQKEHLAAQQVMIKQMHHMQGGPHGMHSQQLHHHSSAHSLQSQPSFGSISGATMYPPTAGPAMHPSMNLPGYLDAQARGSVSGQAGASLGPDGMPSDLNLPHERLGLNRLAHGQFSGSQEGMNHPQQVAAVLQDRARLQKEQEQHDAMQRHSTAQGDGSERLEEFHRLRGDGYGLMSFNEHSAQAASATTRPQGFTSHGNMAHVFAENDDEEEEGEETDQASLEASQAAPTQSPWGTVDTSLPQPFPPPQTSSPLPAPAAQRNRQHVADTLAIKSQSRSQTPSLDTPSTAVAPWAKDATDGPKGPSLREIQEAEAKRAAEQELVNTAARQALAKQERQKAMRVTSPAPGLPSTAQWATSNPATPTSPGPSAWAKPLAGKPAASTSGTKKTLAQIQKEEEARKARVAAAAAATTSSGFPSNATSVAAGGKRYADLAGKVAAPSVNSGSAWTTVGAGGKAKATTGPATAAPKSSVAGVNSSGGGSVRSRSTVAPVAASSGTSGTAATDELQKWAKAALNSELNKGINVDDFVRNLLQLPPEPEILSDSVYVNSETLDGRRFADEFIRRRRMADKGIVPDAAGGANFSSSSKTSEPKNTGGWSEVAKKGPPVKEEVNSAFRVVATKKKGKR